MVFAEVVAEQLSAVGERCCLDFRCDSEIPPAGGLCDELTRDDCIDSPAAHFGGSNAIDEPQMKFPTFPLTDELCVKTDERASN